MGLRRWARERPVSLKKHLSSMISGSTNMVGIFFDSLYVLVHSCGMIQDDRQVWAETDTNPSFLYPTSDSYPFLSITLWRYGNILRR